MPAPTYTTFHGTIQAQLRDRDMLLVLRVEQCTIHLFTHPKQGLPVPCSQQRTSSYPAQPTRGRPLVSLRNLGSLLEVSKKQPTQLPSHTTPKKEPLSKSTFRNPIPKHHHPRLLPRPPCPPHPPSPRKHMTVRHVSPATRVAAGSSDGLHVMYRKIHTCCRRRGKERRRHREDETERGRFIRLFLIYV